MCRVLLAVLFAISLVAPMPADAKSRPLQPAERVTLVVASGKSLSPAFVRDSIVVVAANRGWMLQAEQPGRITLRNVIRGKHTVVVAVDYDSAGFKVDYVSSENLNYKLRNGKAYIHPKYQQWVNTLIQDVLAKVALS